MNNTEKMNTIEKVKIILQTINMIMEKLEFHEDKIGVLFINDMEKIIQEKKLFENIDMKIISSFEINYISIDEFRKTDIFYDILYEMLLSKIHGFINKKEKNITQIALFHNFNQAYFYKKFIKYMIQFIDKYQETLNDDIIKEKIFEIVHSLQSSDKIYLQEFYFYISMFTIHYYYPKNDIPFPEFEKFKDTSFSNKKMKSFVNKLMDEKSYIIDTAIYYLKCIHSKGNLIEFLSIIEKENEEKNIFNIKNYNNFDLNVTINETEKKLSNYLKENESDVDLINLYEHLDSDNNKKKIFQFYFLDGMKSFLSLNEEDKYVIVNSYNANKQKVSLQIMHYIEMKKSYDEGMKEQNILKDTIQNIIENESFFNDLRDIFTSEKVVDYCKNPLQYKEGTSDIEIYGEKILEKEKNKKRLNKGNRGKDISKFTYPKKQNEKNKKEILNSETQEIPDICSYTLDDDLENIEKEEEYICQFYLDYVYFMKNVFKKGFLKERIMYSFLPYGIKAFVHLIPKIVINMCGNNITSYNIEANDSENYKTILKGLYTVIIMHELIHFIRRENPDRPLSNEYTPIADNETFEGGKSFIYHIFGTLVVIFMDLEFAKVILNKDSWKKDCQSLKEQYSRFKNKKDDEIINSFKENELIKCYDSIIEISNEPVEDYDFCCRLTP